MLFFSVDYLFVFFFCFNCTLLSFFLHDGLKINTYIHFKSSVKSE